MGKSQSEKNKSGLKALKDFKIVHNKECHEIKKGDDLSSIPKMFLENLKTEGVIKSAPKEDTKE